MTDSLPLSVYYRSVYVCVCVSVPVGAHAVCMCTDTHVYVGVSIRTLQVTSSLNMII